MDTLSRLKEKPSTSQIIRASEYEFLTSYTVEVCVSHLDTMKAKYKFKRPPIWNVAGFYFDEFDAKDGIVQFGIEANTGKIGVNGKVIGLLIPQSDNQTLVKMEIGYTYWSVVLQILLLPFIALMFLLMHQVVAGLIAIILVYGFLITLTLVSCSDLKPTLYRTVYEALSIPKAPHPQTLPP